MPTWGEPLSRGGGISGVRMYAIHLILGIVSLNCNSVGVWEVPVIRKGPMHSIVVIV